MQSGWCSNGSILIARARACAVWSALALGATGASARQFIVPGPDPDTRRFGSQIIVLPAGTYLVTDPDWGAEPGQEPRGAVYHFAEDGEPISRLTGARAGDRIGSGGIVVLPGGDFVVQSPSWRATDAILDAGAVTFGDALTGFGGQVDVSATNSLVGSSTGDRVGASRVVPLANGSYVVASGEWDRAGVAVNAGAVTWCDPGGGTVGEVSPTNSLVGSRDEDRVGDLSILSRPAVIALNSGHYAVASDRWDHGVLADAGAVTWGSNDGSTVGEVSALNSIVGASAGDFVGSEIQALANGHFVVQSPFFDHGGVGNVGAVTWAQGDSATATTVSPANSLVGASEYDIVGLYVAPLTNGHYVVLSPVWDRDGIENAGAVTWRDGTGPAPGLVSAGNSLVGSSLDDSVGWFTTIGIPALGVIALDNGHYLVASPSWDEGSVRDVGAATWGNGAGGLVGPVTRDNSLVGGTQDDAIAQYVVTLDNGGYVIGSPFWSEQRGAATWGDGLGPLVGVVDADTSLVGSQPDDFVSASGIYPLANGDYVVGASRWSQGELLRVGAVTRGDGATGVRGEVSPGNSLVGLQANDQVGLGGVFALPDGDYLVRSGLASGYGAITRTGFPLAPGPAHVEAANSLSGRTVDDRIGGPGATVLPDGRIVLYTANIAQNNAGAVALFAAHDRFRGFLPEPDTVRSTQTNGGPLLRHAYLPSSEVLLVGDPLGNRIVRMTLDRILGDGFE